MQGGPKPDTSSERQRRWHAKVTSGCITCRRRRVKCDEQRPVCKSCSRLKLTCHGNGYGRHASTASADTKTVSDFHITTPDSYEQRRRSDTSTASDQSSASTSSRYEISPKVLQQRTLASSTVRLPSVSLILGADKYAPWNNPYVTDASITDRQNFEHAFFRQFSGFLGDKAQDPSAIQTELMSYAMCDPVVWYAFIYAGASHRAYWADRAIDGPPLDLTRQYLKTRAIRTMLQALQDRNGEIPDSMLMGMLILSSHGSGESVRREPPSKLQSRKTLFRTLDTEYYGVLVPAVEHLKILYKLIEHRGGIWSIKSRTVMMGAVLFDVWNAWKLLSRPGLPMLQPLSEVLKLRAWTLDSYGNRLYRRLTTSLVPLVASHDLPGDNAILHIIEGLRILTTDFNQLQRSPEPDTVLRAPDRNHLIWIRSTILHSLLSLPVYKEQALKSEHSGDPACLIYELCRVSCFMYAQVWLCPVVNTRNNLSRKLLSEIWPLLTASISWVYDGSTLSDRYPGFFLWAVILSLLCAYEDCDVTGEPTSMQKISQLVVHTQIERLAESWPKIVDILERFLWADFECNLTGQEAWQQACVLSSIPAG